jgi:hypothetical protein
MANRKTRIEVERSFKKANPSYDNLTIRVMVAYQLDGGWDGVNALLSDLTTPGLGELLGMEP